MAKQPTTLFGHRLRIARVNAGIAQDKLGVMIGLDESCSSARISRYESGIHTPPFGTAERIAEVLNTPVAYFYCANDLLAESLLELSKLNPKKINEALTFIKSLNEIA